MIQEARQEPADPSGTPSDRVCRPPWEARPDPVDTFGPLATRSPKMRRLFAHLRRLALAPGAVLLTGETGSGKEVIARALHQVGRGETTPFVAVNCGAFPAGLVESELFGHERGAFTGATAQRIGAFEEAGEGTLLLDEIGELPLSLQSRLLRVLEEKSVRRVGGHADVPVVARTIFATHRNLRAEVNAGRFRADLFHRLAVFPVSVPPLRERTEDLRLLVSTILPTVTPAGLALRMTPAAMERLHRYRWPGNVRELRNVLARAAVFASGDRIEEADLRLDAGPRRGRGAGEPRQGRTLAEHERELIHEVLRLNEGNRSATARELGISRSTLREKLLRYARGDPAHGGAMHTPQQV